MRALTARPAAALRLLHTSDRLLVELAAEELRQPSLFDGLHVFSLGGLRTAGWLQRPRHGRAGGTANEARPRRGVGLEGLSTTAARGGQGGNLPVRNSASRSGSRCAGVHR